MKVTKRFFVGLLSLAFGVPAFSGGLLTNTNQNAAFLRKMTQDGVIDITGLYFNPAGTAFLDKGFHLSLNVQNAKQGRDITTTFPLFAYNVNNRSTEHLFEGNAKAPVIPSFQASYNWDRWSLNASLALGGGGGKCEFDRGLGSFEALYSANILSQLQSTIMPGIVGGVTGILTNQFMQAGMDQTTAGGMAQQLAATTQFDGYSLNAYMKGRSYQFHLTLGGTYKFLDNLSGFVGLRFIYSTNNYNGYVSDVNAHFSLPAAGQFPGYSGSTPLNQDLTLNCNQSGFTAQPVIGLDWKANDKWNFSFKYELPSKLQLKNESEMNDLAKQQAAQPGNVLGQFADGKKIREDIPGIMFAGAQYSPISSLRLNAGWHWYFDKQAKKYGNSQKLIDKGSLELTAGAEYDICKWLTVSAGWQTSRYRVSDAYMNDVSFNMSSNSIGAGFRFHATKHCNIDLGYMHTFYEDRNVTTSTAAGDKVDLYKRTNRVFGLGVNLSI